MVVIGYLGNLKKDASIPKSPESISPFEAWIAEGMLQQTQLKVVIPCWEKWMKIFLDLAYLEEAYEQKVLLLCLGLGYYSRAKRIHHSSKY